MAMPSEHLHPRIDVKQRDTNMLEVITKTATSTTAPSSRTYRVGGTTMTNTVTFNGSGNDQSDAATEPSRSQSQSQSYSHAAALNSNDIGNSSGNSNGDVYMTSNNNNEINKRYYHRPMVSKTTTTTTKQGGGGGGGAYNYVARPSREAVLQRLSEALLRRSLHKIDLSQRNLQASDAKLVKMALAQNANLTVLKLGYNNLGDAGVATLAAGIVAHKSLNLLDLGFNNIGDEGIRALAHCMQKASEQQRLCNGGDDDDGSSTLHTLYLAGNLIGEDGAMAMADFLRQGSRLTKLFMAGNRIGGDGVKAITEAILEQETSRGPSTSTRTIAMLEGVSDAFESLNDYRIENPAVEAIENGIQRENDVYGNQITIQTTISSSSPSFGVQVEQATNNNRNKNNFLGMQELFLGGTGMELTGCQAVSRLLEKSSYLRVLSLPNCDIGDEEVCMLALSIKSNKGRLPIESLQLSFNNITHKGLEAMANALWGSTTLRELKVDNNIIGDRGAHQMAAIIPAMKAIEVLDVGFNSITASGLTALMKTVAESKNLLSLSVSGNAIDANAAKSVAYALAYNCSLQSIFLVHCSIGHEEQRHIAAGIVSNSRTALDRLNGFEIGRE